MKFDIDKTLGIGIRVLLELMVVSGGMGTTGLFFGDDVMFGALGGYCACRIIFVLPGFFMWLSVKTEKLSHMLGFYLLTLWIFNPFVGRDWTFAKQEAREKMGEDAFVTMPQRG